MERRCQVTDRLDRQTVQCMRDEGHGGRHEWLSHTWVDELGRTVIGDYSKASQLWVATETGTLQ
jgi:hypothetical protein